MKYKVVPYSYEDSVVFLYCNIHTAVVVAMLHTVAPPSVVFAIALIIMNSLVPVAYESWQ